MTRRSSYIITVFTLLFSLLANPLFAVASAIKDASDQPALNVQVAGDMEHCHEQVMASDSLEASLSDVQPSDLQSQNPHVECCDTQCQCAQMGCHASSAAISTNFCYFPLQQSLASSWNHSYNSPSLLAANPPPIF